MANRDMFANVRSVSLEEISKRGNTPPRPPSPFREGYISMRATVWCSCGQWDDLATGQMRKAKEIAKSKGWQYSRKYGWKCPGCLQKEKNEV